MNVKLSFGTATAMKAIDFLGWFLVFFRLSQQFLMLENGELYVVIYS